MEICIKHYNFYENMKNIITVDYLVIGGKKKIVQKVSLEGGRLNLTSHFVFWYYDNMFCLSVCDETRATTVSPL